MTIDEFANKNKIKKETVIKWIGNNLIPKANIENNYVPESARLPYTGARAKTANSIYYSIVKASINRKHVLPVLYGICDDEFNAYIERLVRAGYIERRVSDDVTYYDATVNCNNIRKKYVLDAIKAIIQGTSEGITSAMLSHTS